MEIFSYAVISFLLIRLSVVMWNWILNPSLKQQTPYTQPLVSILIPARNEAENLPHLFTQLTKLHYAQLEFIILNDQSEDQTEAVLQQWTATDSRIHYLNGAPLPQGWLGKNWACHQLALQAKGAYFLFLDADVAYLHDEVILSALSEIHKRKLTLLSIFPDQLMQSNGEKGVVPLMHYLLLSLLPLAWIFYLPWSHFAAANGQFMLFEAQNYRTNQWHACVKSQIVEDIAIMRLVKLKGYKGMAFIANGMIQTRMYRSYKEALQGFSKNILAGFGNKTVVLLVFLALVCGVLGIVINSWILGASALGIIFLIKIGTTLLAKQSLWINLIYHPWQIVNLLIISILSIYRKYSGNNQWKGRNVQLKSR